MLVIEVHARVSRQSSSHWVTLEAKRHSNWLTWHSLDRTLPGGDREVHPGFRHHKAGGKSGPKVHLD